ELGPDPGPWPSAPALAHRVIPVVFGHARDGAQYFEEVYGVSGLTIRTIARRMFFCRSPAKKVPESPPPAPPFFWTCGRLSAPDRFCPSSLQPVVKARPPAPRS